MYADDTKPVVWVPPLPVKRIWYQRAPSEAVCSPMTVTAAPRVSLVTTELVVPGPLRTLTLVPFMLALRSV